MPTTINALDALYGDSESCAHLIGLNYIDGQTPGLIRLKRGKGFLYKDSADQVVIDKTLKEHIASLVIPPAWQDVWICPDQKGHVLATGIDEKGRKQYIYHPKWRTMRDLIKFYRLIIFGRSLPVIRSRINEGLAKRTVGLEKIMAAMLWILDNTYIRIGNDIYFNENESVGLTTLTDKNIIIAGSVVTLAFKGKSGKDQQLTFENKTIAHLLDGLRKLKGARLFRYPSDQGLHDITAEDINAYLHELSGVHISAKDFRTWGGTLMAFLRLIETEKAAASKPQQAVIMAVDQAAAILGNTRSIARASYVHPDLLHVYASKNFKRYYEQAGHKRVITGLDNKESRLLHFLELLFHEEFDLLKIAKVKK